MARAARITRDDIIAAAVELVRTQGHESLNARSLAAMLGCSTQPVLYHFASMDEVRSTAYQAIDELRTTYLMEGLEAAADPLLVPVLLSFGLTEFSVSAPSVLRTRRTISRWTIAEADELVEKIMKLKTSAEVRAALQAAAR